MIRIALCDDESKILEDASSYIKKYAESKTHQAFEIFCFDSAKSLVNALDDAKNFDIFLLDVYIGAEMGTALAREIRQRGIENPIMFLTSSVDHAPESFEMGTLRYLVKPIDPQKLYEAMDVAVTAVEALRRRTIKLKTENGVESVNASHIMYSEAHGHYQYVTLKNGSLLRVRITVAELYEMLIKNGGFIRVGSAYIINLRNIKNVSNLEVHLYNDISIPIPRGKHTEIKKAFWDFHYEEQE